MRINNGLQHYVQLAKGPFELRVITVDMDASNALTELGRHMPTHPASAASGGRTRFQCRNPLPNAYQPWCASDELPSAKDDTRSVPAPEINNNQNQREKRIAEADKPWCALDNSPSAKDNSRSILTSELNNNRIQ
jgi:hypothetical protein